MGTHILTRLSTMKLFLFKNVCLLSIVAVASGCDDSDPNNKHKDCPSDEHCKTHWEDRVMDPLTGVMGPIPGATLCRKKGRDCKNHGTNDEEGWGCAKYSDVDKYCGIAIAPSTKWGLCHDGAKDQTCSDDDPVHGTFGKDDCASNSCTNNKCDCVSKICTNNICHCLD